MHLSLWFWVTKQCACAIHFQMCCKRIGSPSSPGQQQQQQQPTTAHHVTQGCIMLLSCIIWATKETVEMNLCCQWRRDRWMSGCVTCTICGWDKTSVQLLHHGSATTLTIATLYIPTTCPYKSSQLPASTMFRNHVIQVRSKHLMTSIFVMRTHHSPGWK